jgi:8-amino-7-oxononanoate synthase
MYKDDFLQPRLDERISGNALRTLMHFTGKVDFSSNDYLGISTMGLLKPFLTGKEDHGSGGARTLSGNYPLIEETEEMIASFHNAGSGLIFSSGFAANTGLMSSVPRKGDTIIYDQLSHASLRDGIKLSGADSFPFLHNDVNDLERRFENTKGNVFVVTESVFSMDGDLAPLLKIAGLCEMKGAHLIVDEAHATGLIGEKGEGLVQHLELEKKVFARVHTFGKAVGTHGAIVLGSSRLKSYLLNFARSFVFTTALPPSSITAIKASYHVFPKMKNERRHLQHLSDLFNKKEISFEKTNSDTPIKAIIIPGNEKVKTVALNLLEKGFDVRPILYPTVPKGKERLRINLHAFNTEEELLRLLQSF